MNSKIKLISFVFITVLLLIIGKAEAGFDNIHSFVLDNGLQVVVIEDHKAPIVKHMVFYKTGSIDEALGKGGLAHLLEHLMFRGTSKIPGQLFNQIMEDNGAISNAFTAQDVTAYHQFLDISRLETAMALEADRMQNLQINADDFEAERQIVFQERKQRIDNNPAAKFYEVLKKNLWQNHPYARQITGEDSEILSLSLQDGLDFYQHYYAPNNAVLVLSGDINEQQARDLAQKYYGVIAKKDSLRSKDLPALVDGYKSNVSMHLPDIKLGRMINIYATPSFNLAPEKVYALEILAEYMGGDKNSPLYQKMVLMDKKAISLDVDYNPLSRSYGTFEIIVIPSDSQDSELNLWLNQAWNYAMHKLDAKTFALTKQKLLSDLVYLQDNPEDIAQLTGYLAAINVDLDVLTDYAQKINEVTLEDVIKIAEELQNNMPQVSGYLYPEQGGSDD